MFPLFPQVRLTPSFEEKVHRFHQCEAKLASLKADYAKKKESCSGKKVYTSEVEVICNGGHDNTFVNYQGKAYTGNVWANDESGYQTFKNGVFTGSVIFHKNGKKAFVITHRLEDDTYSYECFDERGNEMSEINFYENYHDFLDKAFEKLPLK